MQAAQAPPATDEAPKLSHQVDLDLKHVKVLCFSLYPFQFGSSTSIYHSSF